MISGFSMYPHYFGSSHESLFGVYYASVARPVRSSGVVLCSPVGHEYIRSHRAFRNLATLLSRHGFPVLRFDYYGCGDSAGEAADGRVTRWIDDVATAIEELTDTAGVSKVSLVGLRFGATLAAMAAQQRRDIDNIVLWDPIRRGAAYLEQLLELQQDWLREGPERHSDSARDGPIDVIGFPLTDRVRREYEAVDLGALGACRARHALVITDPSRDDGDWSALFDRLHVPSTHWHASDVGQWHDPEMVHETLLPQEVLGTIVSFMSRRQHERPEERRPRPVLTA